MLQIKKETANISQYKVEIHANIGNLVRLWKPEYKTNNFQIQVMPAALSQ